MIIREVLDQFLKKQEERLSKRTYSGYASVIELFGHFLQSYAWNFISKEEYDKYDEYEKQGREFADVYSHDEICHNIPEFLGYFMLRKVMAGKEFTQKTAPRVMRSLLRWMTKKGLITKETMEAYLPR
ncbi:hypothetical protein GF312_15800 [Candidatus Poribacteria bacterium]|nr:hypothetical protein [Candidatus Poribacteria bacterium]